MIISIKINVKVNKRDTFKFRYTLGSHRATVTYPDGQSNSETDNSLDLESFYDWIDSVVNGRGFLLDSTEWSKLTTKIGTFIDGGDDYFEIENMTITKHETTPQN